MMKTRYHVCGLGYDKDNCMTDYDNNFGDFDTYDEACELFVKLMCRSEKLFVDVPSDIYYMIIQIEECEEVDSEINCVNVKKERYIINPNAYQKASRHSVVVPNKIMEIMRKRRYLDEDDISEDEEILEMSGIDFLDEWLAWEGIYGYTYHILQIIEQAFGIDLESWEFDETIKRKVEEKYEDEKI